MADIGTYGNPLRGVTAELSQHCHLLHALPAIHQQSTWEAPKEAKYKKGRDRRQKKKQAGVWPSLPDTAHLGLLCVSSSGLEQSEPGFATVKPHG